MITHCEMPDDVPSGGSCCAGMSNIKSDIVVDRAENAETPSVISARQFFQGKQSDQQTYNDIAMDL